MTKLGRRAGAYLYLFQALGMNQPCLPEFTVEEDDTVLSRLTKFT